VARTAPARETALAKARMGLDALGGDLALASEGSFGPHPRMPLIAGGQEWLAFVDRARGLEVVETDVTAVTNYAQTQATAADALDGWLSRVGFPSHAVIVRPEAGAQAFAPGLLVKGIRDTATLTRAVAAAAAASDSGLAWVETDMRAHLNPTRMRALGRLGLKLARRLATACPACGGPGFGPTGVERGLPCAWCAEPTDLPRAEIFSCPSCDHVAARAPRHGLERADPGSCQSCNP
jgi:hypothetical protein